jgi:hypothetical protein
MSISYVLLSPLVLNPPISLVFQSPFSLSPLLIFFHHFSLLPRPFIFAPASQLENKGLETFSGEPSCIVVIPEKPFNQIYKTIITSMFVPFHKRCLTKIPYAPEKGSSPAGLVISDVTDVFFRFVNYDIIIVIFSSQCLITCYADPDELLPYPYQYKLKSKPNRQFIPSPYPMGVVT